MKFNLTSKFLVLSTLTILFSYAPCKAQIGSLDPSFDTDGKVTSAIGNTYDAANAVAIQMDGKIVVAGASTNGLNAEFAVARYNPNGSLDLSFDTDGKVSTAIGPNGGLAYAVAIQNDGKILVAGESVNGTNKDFALVRYNSNGSLDLTFDTDGIVITPIGTLIDVASAIKLQSDGKIILAGYSHNGHDFDFALARYNIDGSLDSSFDTDGLVTTSIDTFTDAIQSIALQPDGKILVGGYTSNGSNSDFIVARYHSSGSLDTTFDTDGFVITTFGNSYDGLYSIALQTDGKIVAAGATFLGSNYDFALVRYNANGSLDLSFDTDGKVTAPIGNGNDRIYAMTLQTDGKIVACGMTENGQNDDLALARFNTNGSLDFSFDADGKVSTNMGTSDDVANAIAMQSDGKIVIAGYSNNGADDDFAVCRYIGNAIGTGIEDLFSAKKELQVYPNPTNSNANLIFNQQVKDATITLYNSFGETVKVIRNISGKAHQIDCTDLVSGTYYINLRVDGQDFAAAKLILQ